MDSPEERLLRFIRRKNPKKAEGAPPQHLQAGRRVSFKTRLKEMLSKDRLYTASALDLFNKALIGVLAIIVAYFGYNLLFPPARDIGFIDERTEIAPSGTSGIVDKNSQQAAMPEKAENYSAYESQIKGKQLFGASSATKSAGEQPAGMDISKKFNLVGIIAGDQPQAIIEDKETQKTYYLYAGQSFGDATVEEVNNGKVVLNYKGERVTLVL